MGGKEGDLCYIGRVMHDATHSLCGCALWVCSVCVYVCMCVCVCMSVCAGPAFPTGDIGGPKTIIFIFFCWAEFLRPFCISNQYFDIKKMYLT